MNLLLTFMCLCLLGIKFVDATATGSDNGPSVTLTRQAVQMGMDPAVLGELWRNKQPVVISQPNSLGQLVTTTYRLSPDEQRILSTSVNEADLPEVPTTTTSTTTPSPVSPQPDWEYVPSTMGHRRVFTTTPIVTNWPSFGDGFPQWTSSRITPNWPSFGFPAGVTPQTSTKTEQDDQGRTVTTTFKTYQSPGFNSFPAINWHNFEFPAGVTPQVSTKTELDDQGRTVTTTTKTYKGPITETNNWSPEEVPATWQPRPNVFAAQRPTWLDRPTIVPTLVPKWANPVPTPLPEPQPTYPTVLPPQPTYPTVLPPLPTYPTVLPPLPTRPTVLPPLPTRPTVQYDQTTPKTIATFNVNELPTYLATNELPTDTRVTSYSSTYNGEGLPKTADLAPPMRDILSNAGITDDDILTAQTTGEDIVRSRVTPDGRVIKTTFRLKSGVVDNPEAALPTVPSTAPLPRPAVVQYQPQPAVRREFVATMPNPTQEKPIEDFLSQVNLRPSDILAQNGEVVRTIVDKDGRVLSAKFVLSTVKGEEEEGKGQGQTGTPTK